jgi:hypothetical protein
MRTPHAVVAALCLSSVCAAAEFNPFQGPTPVAVFIQTNPWAMVIGADTPRVALYDNGELIFVKKANDRLAYRHVTLAEDQLQAVRDRLKPVLALKGLKPHYNVRPDVTDQPEALFYFRDGTREVATSVYGLMAAETKLAGEATVTTPPNALLELHKWLCDLDYPGSEEWSPKYVEVMLWDYSYAPDASIHWPKEWPSLKSDRAIKRGDSYSIFLDGASLPKLREFLGTRKAKGAVEIEGKKMAVSYRMIFPGEPAWFKALR